ncbi:endonuclease [Gaoshiqia sediminis]|uniref:Endonuclease n=1 Tax=Gaoshiqia sediminis TaxID=2986998 RepID=A0AA42C8R2_9BACT|nr:endonuclease [Gaoshiqia sediminis]MCW0481175.1 endonuclease [Gaoshiqia sediminis]
MHQTWELMNVLRKNVNKYCLIYFVFAFLPFALFSQEGPATTNFYILFYNVENLWDTKDDPQNDDDEFLPQGDRHWTFRRLNQKLNNTAKVILASCGFDAPAIVGLCEVENRGVLDDLTTQTPLSGLKYRIIHKDSPDHRGIDVALLYQPEQVVPIEYEYLPLIGEKGSVLLTREILQACFLFPTGDTLHVFVNHWPSRYSGQAETEAQRLLAAHTLRKAVDELLAVNSRVKVVIMGDFNDQPQNKSMRITLGTVPIDTETRRGLVNLSAAWPPDGTLKHQQSWQVFDQLVVTDCLLSPEGLHTTPADAQIVKLPFLFEPDPKYGGRRLFRTYLGFKYQGGFSDHLPVRLKLTYTD